MAQKLVTLLLLSVLVLILLANTDGAVWGRRETDTKKTSVSKVDKEAAALALSFMLFLGFFMEAMAPHKEKFGVTSKPVTTPQITIPDSSALIPIEDHEVGFVNKLNGSRAEDNKDADRASDDIINVKENHAPTTEKSSASVSKLKKVFYEASKSGEVMEFETDLEINQLAPVNNVVATDKAKDFPNLDLERLMSINY